LENVKIYLHKFLLTMYITDLQYFGTVQYIQTLMLEREVYFDNMHPYSKMSFKNRTIIATAQGPLTLSIPIIGGRDQKSPMRDIKIDYKNEWDKQHIKAIVSNYNRSPFFEYYENDLSQLLSNHTLYLVDFLINCNEWLNKQLKSKWNSHKLTEIILDRSFDAYLPKNYNKIKNPIIYQQVFDNKTGFLPNLSILDLLFCCGGKQASVLLMST
jgi:hypothetical protein